MTRTQELQSSFRWAWNVERAPDGTLWVTQGTNWRLSNGLGWLGCALMLGFLLGSLVAVAPKPIAPRAGAYLGLYGLLPLTFLVLALRTLLRREAWRAGPGFLEIQREILGARRVWRFTDATFPLGWQGATRNSGARWRLFVQGQTGRRFLTDGPSQSQEGLEASDLLILARLLSEATHFPLQDRPIEIRHANTGQVLRVVRGGTLAGARLVGSRLAGADLQGAELRGADLRGADLRGADLKGAVLTGAKLQGLRQVAAEVGWSGLMAMLLLDAFLRSRLSLPGGLLLPAILFVSLLILGLRMRLWRAVPTQLTAADLSGADLTSADLTGVRLPGVTYDAHTRWPAGFDPKKHGAILEK